ncbi:hypothetical protein DVK02_05520 [Halobellus sp. Atlit-31R]|nr:hypothetical protein DVK02_05520 [Halobellus sp. Atlit-31R]
MSDTLSDRQRQTLDAVRQSPDQADADDVELLAALAGRGPEGARTDAAEALSFVAAERPGRVADAVSLVLLSLQSGDVNVRAFALDTVATLARQSPERVAATTAITNVAQALNDRNEWIRASAAEALGDVGSESPELLEDTGVARALVHRLGSEEFSDARAQMARALGRIAQTAPELLGEQEVAALERLVDEDDEIEESLRFAVGAVADARAPSNGATSDSQRATATAFCPACGTEITTDPVPNFCRECGQELP